MKILPLKSNDMKNKAKILGLISAVLIALSAILKVNHLPGASLGLVLSLGLLFPIYIAINILSLIKDSKFNSSVVILGLFFLLFSIGFLFVIMHWPLGGLLFKAGFILTLITLIIFYFLSNKTEDTTGKFPILLIAFSIVMISMTYLASFRGIARNVVDGFVQSNENSSLTKDVFIQLNEQCISTLDSSSSNLIEVHKITNDLINNIESIKLELARIANDNQNVSDYSQIRFKENFDITNQVLIIQGVASQLKQQIFSYQSRLTSLNIDETSKIQINRLLDTYAPPMIEGRAITWESSKFEHFPVISAIATLTSIQVNILTAENIVIKKDKK